MALVLKDRVKETTTTTGTGTVTLAGASTGYQSFSVIGNANTTYYCIAGQGTAEWEVGIGTYTASGTTLSRDTILASSNSGSVVTFSAGTKDVFVVYPAGKSVNLDASNNATALGTVASATLTNATGLPISTGVSGLGTGVATALAVNTGSSGAFVVNGGALGTPSSGTVTNLTGTASININGTVGATTPNTGAFTTLSASGVATFSAGSAAAPAITTSGDTNTGIFFPAADTIAFTEGGAEALRIDSSANVGIGTTSPGSKLDVKGTLRLSGSTSGYVGLAPAAAAGSTTYTLPSADGSSGQVLSTNGTGTLSWATAGGGGFAAGTAMLFVQTAAPTGWTKSTTHNDKALRVVSGSASSGGSVAFTTAFASQGVSGTVGNTTLTTSQIPSHSHTFYTSNTGGGSNRPRGDADGSTNENLVTTSTTGTGGSHNHSFSGTAINLAVQYVDVIIATKD